MFDYVLKKIVGTKNQRELKRMQPLVARINERESWAKSLSDEQIREQVRAWRKEVSDDTSYDDCTLRGRSIFRRPGGSSRTMRGACRYDQGARRKVS